VSKNERLSYFRNAAGLPYGQLGIFGRLYSCPRKMGGLAAARLMLLGCALLQYANPMGPDDRLLGGGIVEHQSARDQVGGTHGLQSA